MHDRAPPIELKHDEEEDDDFDFGKAKMDFFKKRAREILMADNDLEYEGVPMPLGGAYKSLKHIVKNPNTVYTKLEKKPGYLKSTFCQGRQAPAGGKFVSANSMLEIQKNVKGSAQSNLNPLLLSHKDKKSMTQYPGDSKENKFLDAVFGKPKKEPTKKEIERDRKVEALLEAYKKQDEETLRKEQQKTLNKKMNQKALLEKFGFSDEEDEDTLGLK